LELFSEKINALFLHFERENDDMDLLHIIAVAILVVLGVVIFRNKQKG